MCHIDLFQTFLFGNFIFQVPWEHFLDVCVIQVTPLHSNHDYLHFIIAISTQWASLMIQFWWLNKERSWVRLQLRAQKPFSQSNSTWEFFFLILVISSNKTPLLLPLHVVLPHIKQANQTEYNLYRRRRACHSNRLPFHTDFRW